MTNLFPKQSDDTEHAFPISRLTSRARRLWRSVVVVGLVAGLFATGSVSNVSAQDSDDDVRTPSGLGNGKVAYVTPGGKVMIADSDGSDAITVGQGAVTNAAGLAPLSWRQPAADAITYVREDGSLVVASIDGTTEQIVAKDAVVPPEADEKLISWNLDGSFLIYLAQNDLGALESRVIDFTSADADNAPEVRVIGNPDRRVVLGQQFAPLDPFIYQRTVDIETGDEFTVAIVEPFGGSIFGTPFTLDDPTFSPDGRFIVAVVTAPSGNQQLVRIPTSSPQFEIVADHDRICSPAVSADGNRVIYASGKNCDEVWVVDINAANDEQVLAAVGQNVTFAVGQFSWSADGNTVTHAYCEGLGTTPICSGEYLDIAVDGSGAKRVTNAGSVLREQVALLRPVTFEIELDGGIVYEGKMQIGAQGTELLEGDDSELVEATAADQIDPDRRVEVKLYQGEDQLFLSGSLKITDGDFEEELTFFGRAQPLSYGFARIRGIWMKTDSMPIRSGQVLITISR